MSLPFDSYPSVSKGAKSSQFSSTFLFENHPILNQFLGQQKHSGNDNYLTDASFLIAIIGLLLNRYSEQCPLPLNLTILQNEQDQCRQIPLSVNIKNEQKLAEYIQDVFALVSNNYSAKEASIDSTNELQVVIVADNEFASPVSFEKLNQQVEAQLGKTELRVIFWIKNDRLEILYHFNQHCFSPMTIESMNARFCQILNQAKSEPLIKNISILDNQQDSWIEKVSRGESVNLGSFDINQRLQDFASNTPEAKAVEFDSQHFNYATLNAKANQLAHFLLQSKLDKKTKVVVLLSPGRDIQTAIFGLFKVGASYIPIDPTLPIARIESIFEDIKPELIITQVDLIDSAKQLGVAYLAIDKQESKLYSQPTDNPEIEFSDELTATIFYTSGTTGKPKGVMASFSNVHHQLSVANKRFAYNHLDVIPAIAKFSFSISIFELLSPIFAGGLSLIIKRDDILDLNKLANILSLVTAAHIGPSLLKLVVANIENNQQETRTNQQQKSSFPNLRHISSGGDMVSPELLTQLQQTFHYSEIYVIYGCSEISCMGVTHFYSNGEIIDKTFVGKPFYNVKMLVLDEHLNKLPYGCIGNVYFAGNGVTKGYLNQPNLTKEKYITIGDTLFYNTGDRGRLNASGDLELLGRLDFQIQLRGIRIELGEIEYQLRKSPRVKDGVIAQKLLSNNKKILIAYVVLENNDAFNQNSNNQFETSEIRNYLSSQLPDYMLPNYYIVLEKLPLNHNLKVDRGALPIPKPEDMIVQEEYIAPQNEIQKQINYIWSKALSIEKISITSDFFQLGGDSLSLANSVTQLHQILSFDVGLAKLFNSPTIQSWSKLISQAKGNVIDFSPNITAITKSGFKISDDHYSYPASFPQKQFWYLYQLDPNACGNNIPFAYHITGFLNIQFLEVAMQIMVNRHENFRTSFAQDSDGTRQVIELQRTFTIQRVNHNFNSIHQSEFKAELNKRANEAFDLENGSLIKMSVFEFSAQEFVVFLSFHHIIIDQTSILQFGLELDFIYKQLVNKQPVEKQTADTQTTVEPASRLESPIESQIEYSDYSVWQQQNQSAEKLKNKIKYWKNTLTGIETYLKFPLDAARTSSMAGRDLCFEFNPQLTQQIETFAKQQQTSVYLVILAAYACCIHRYTNQKDIIVGTPFANRAQQPELETVMGCFINTLPVVTHFNHPMDFVQLLQQMKSHCYLVAENQAVPMELILDAVKPERSSNYNPIYQVGLTYQDAPLQLSFEQCTSQPIDLESQAAQLDFIARLWHSGSNIKGVMTYNSSILEAESMRNFIEHFKTILSSAIRSPQNNINQLNLFSSKQYQQLSSWNKFNHQPFCGSLLLEKFEQQVKLQPNETALEFGQQILSYQQLNRKAEKLADYLLFNGVLKGEIIGVYCDRSFELIIAIYAIIKAGAVYCPIDPEHPISRVEYLVKEANMKTVISHSAVQELDLKDLKLVSVDQQWEQISRTPTQHKGAFSNNDTAYVIYTSGSTGKPKGVKNSHYGVLNSFNWMQDAFKLTNKDVLLLKTPITFDVSIWEIFWPLMFGAKMVIAKPDGHKDTTYLKKIISERKVTFLNFVPSMLQVLLEEEDLTECSHLRNILSGGELLSFELTQLFFKRCRAKLYNGYGPTETAICVSLWHCEPDASSHTIPIGYPAFNTQFHLLDEFQNRVPFGAIGELYISGNQVAQGYLNRQDLTDDRFVSLPKLEQLNLKPQTQNDLKYYRTGDLLRQLANGSFAYVGRKDFQIKLRGLRIELGEIENILLGHKQVEQATVVYFDNSSHEKNNSHKEKKANNSNQQFLVGYFTSQKSLLDISQLKSYLGTHLPSYMVPSYFIQVKRFPITVNGKVDRKALPMPEFKTLNRVERSEQLNSHTEIILVKIWMDLIQTKNIFGDDNFFDVGGHSLLAIQAISRIKKKFGVELTPLAMIRDTLAQIANQIDNKSSTNLRNSGLNRDEKDLQAATLFHGDFPQTRSRQSKKTVPFYFSKQKELFGIFYEPPQNINIVGAVLLCSPLYSENINSHQSYRRLAKQLTETGFHVLRFDYYATGNSLGDCSESNFERWKKDVKIAADELRKRSGNNIISIVGLRFGANLAMLSALDNISKLVLWEPINEGNEYIQHLTQKYHKSLDELNLIRKKKAEFNRDQISGFCFSEKMRSEIEKIKLVTSLASNFSHKYLIVSTRDRSSYSEFLDAAKIDKINLQFIQVKEQTEAIEDLTELVAYLPNQSLTEIVDFLSQDDDKGLPLELTNF